MGCFKSKPKRKPEQSSNPLPSKRSNAGTGPSSPAYQTSAPTEQIPPKPTTSPKPNTPPKPITPAKPSTNQKPEPIPDVNLTEPPPIILPAEPYDRDETVHLAVSNLLGTLSVPIQTTASTPCKEFYALVRAHARKISTKQFLLGYKGRILYDCEKTLGEWGVSKDGEIDCYFQP